MVDIKLIVDVSAATPIVDMNIFMSTCRASPCRDMLYSISLGKTLDDETGLYYYGARYYSPKLGRFITPDTIVQSPGDPQTFNRYAYCGGNPVNRIDPSGHSWFEKFFGKILGTIAGVCTAFVTGDFMLGYQVFNAIDSAYTAIVTKSWLAFECGILGGSIAGPLGMSWAGEVAGMLGKSAFTFGGGFLIGATEFGVAGFGSAFGGALGSGAGFKDSMKAGGIGLGIGVVAGGLIQGTYASGKQKTLHGLSREEMGKAAGVKRKIQLKVVKEPLPGYKPGKNGYNSSHWGIEIIDNYNEFSGIWDFSYQKSPINDLKVLTGNDVQGIARPQYNKQFSLNPQNVSRNLNYITKVYRNIHENLGYHYYNVQTYNCQKWVNNRLALKNDSFTWD